MLNRHLRLYGLCLLGTMLLVAPGLAQEPQAATDQDQGETQKSGAGLEIVVPGVSGDELGELRALAEDEAGAVTADGNRDRDKAATPFRIGMIPRGDTARFLKRLQPVRNGLGDLLGRPIEILPMASFSAMIDAHVLRRIDLAFYSASAFVLADRLCRCVEPLVLPLAADGTTSYYAIVVARRDSGLKDIAGLRGKSVAASSVESIGGYRIQMASMIREGFDVQSHFREIRMIGSGIAALRDVRDGHADAAFVWSSMNGQQSAGYSRGPLARLIRDGELSMNELTIIWQSKPIAHAPVAGLKSLSAAERDAVRTYLLALPESDTETYDLLDVHYGGGYREASISDFRGVGVLADVDLRPPRPAATGSVPASVKVMPVPRTRPDPPASSDLQ